MAIRFADLEVSVNGSVTDNLSNKILVIDSNDVEGIFSKQYVEARFVESNNPTFTAKSSDLIDVVQGCKAEDGSKQYEVVGVEPDGTGLTKLELRLEWLT